MFNNFLKSLVNLIKFTRNNKKKEFVFYSESKFYRDYYISLILELKRLGQKNIILVTSDIDDVDFFKNTLTCYYIKNFFILSIFFKILNCKFLILTLTDLGEHLQKSKLCKFYVYFFHALASSQKIYTKTAFKNYDIILSNGKYQSEELRSAEKQFSFPKKEIVDTGYFFLDSIRNKANFRLKEKKHILFAPSWNYNKNNLFDDYSIDIIKNLLSSGFKLTLRPHPEHYKRSNQVLKKITNIFLNNKNFILDKNISNLNSLEKSEILITDSSSIVFEFMFIFKRPIIYIEYKDKVHNIDFKKKSISSIDEEFKDTFGNKININDISNLSNLCEKLIVQNNLSSQSVNLFEKKYLSNLGNSSKFAANYLVKKLKSI